MYVRVYASVLHMYTLIIVNMFVCIMLPAHASLDKLKDYQSLQEDSVRYGYLRK
jgi:hypothetical protein